MVERRRRGHREASRRPWLAAEYFRRSYHQRQTWPSLPLPGEAYVCDGSGVRQNVPASNHQRGAQRRPLLRHRRPQHDGRGDRRHLREAVFHGGRRGRAGADHQCPGPGGPVPRAILYCCPAVRGRAARRRQQDRHCRLSVQGRCRFRRDPGPAALAGAQRHGVRRRFPGQAPEPGASELAGERRPAVVLHDRDGREPLPDLREQDPPRRLAQQHHVRDAGGRSAPGALQPRRGRVPAGLPRQAGEGVQLHRRAADGEPRHVAGNEAGPARVQLDRRAGPTRHQPADGGVAPVPPPWLQLLRRRAGDRELRFGQGPGEVQLGRPAGAEHGGRADGRLDSNPVQSQQSRGLVHALPPGSPHDVGAQDGLSRGGRRRAGRVRLASSGGPATLLGF